MQLFLFLVATKAPKWSDRNPLNWNVSQRDKSNKTDLLLTQGSITFAAGTGGSAQILLDLLLMEKCKNCSPHTHVANFTEVKMNKSFYLDE